MKIDIGCGDGRRTPPDYDVCTDIIAPRTPMPCRYIQCYMEEMPFKNKEFDYARSHHSIEHCENPGMACSEMVRIAKAGIISFPPPQAEMMFGRKDHLWFVFIDHGRLMFVRKRYPSYGIPRRVTGSELNVSFEWKESFEWLVVL
jgi:SAM-dependent methyltransferase